LALVQQQQEQQHLQLQLQGQLQLLLQHKPQQDPIMQQFLPPHKSHRVNDSGGSLQKSSSERAQLKEQTTRQQQLQQLGQQMQSNVIQPSIVSSNNDIAHNTVIDITMNAASIEYKAATVTNSKLSSEMVAAFDWAESKYPTHATPAPTKACSIKNNNSKNKENTNGYESDNSDGSLVF
jgi:hypothetical protein